MNPETENLTPQPNEIPVEETANWDAPVEGLPPETPTEAQTPEDPVEEKPQEDPVEEKPKEKAKEEPADIKPTGFSLPANGRELTFFVMMLISGLGMFNSLLFGGANLGFAIFAVLMIVSSLIYLIASGKKPTFYSVTMLLLSAATAAAFARSDDSPVKFIAVIFLFFGVNLGLCLIARVNRRNPGTIRSLLDAPGTLFSMGLGKVFRALGGLFVASRRDKHFWKKFGSFLLGVCIALPLIIVITSLLTSADAAFSGLLEKLPQVDVWEIFTTIFIGSVFTLVFYARGVGLRYAEAPKTRKPRERRMMNPITVNTVLLAVAAVYVLYLISQIAYFTGGFFGILPENYTLAQYARRGFFEMAFLCGINLVLLAGCTFLVRDKGRVNVLTKLLCLFLGLVTLFLVCTASAKMWLYISSFGLTRMRVLTQVVMLFLAFVDLVAMVWLFVPKLPYMKFFATAALLLCALTVWTDVDTLVASHNTEAYLSGRTDTVDVAYLRDLSHSAVPYLARLAQEAPDAQVAEEAQRYLTFRSIEITDYRGWNYASATARKYVSEAPEQNTDVFGVRDPVSEG